MILVNNHIAAADIGAVRAPGGRSGDRTVVAQSAATEDVGGRDHDQPVVDEPCVASISSVPPVAVVRSASLRSALSGAVRRPALSVALTVPEFLVPGIVVSEVPCVLASASVSDVGMSEIGMSAAWVSNRAVFDGSLASGDTKCSVIPARPSRSGRSSLRRFEILPRRNRRSRR
jgi:hypothetical protein